MSPIVRFCGCRHCWLGWHCQQTGGRLTSREGVFPRHFRVLARVETMPHRSTPLLLLLPALPAIVLLLAIAHRASQLRMRTSVCSSQTMTGLRTFNPKVVGSSPTGGTPPASAPPGTGVFFIPGAPAAALACCSVPR